MHVRSVHARVVRHLATFVAAALVAATLATASAGQASAASGPAFRLWLYTTCVTVTGTPTAPVTLEQRSAAGTLIAKANLAFNGSGQVAHCFEDAFFPGMQVVGTSMGVTRTFTIPRLRARADRTTDVISGRSPAGAAVSVQVIHSTHFNSSIDKTWTRTASSTGTWTIDTTSSFNLIGGDVIIVRWTNGTDAADLLDFVPWLTVRIGSSRVQGSVPVGTSGTVTLRSSSGTIRATSSLAGTPATVEGWATNVFRNSSGTPVAVRIGDRVSAPFQPSMAFTVPTLTVSINTTTDTVSGTCPAGRKIGIEVSGGFAGAETQTTCTSAGTYSKAPGVDLASGVRVTTTARIAGGDLVVRTRVAP